MVQPPYKRILLMGDSGTGKTRFIGTMPKPYVVDFDNGLATLAGQDVMYDACYGDGGWKRFKDTLQLWRKEPLHGAETFALDSLTMAADQAMDYVLKKNNRTGQPSIADWGEAIREVKDMLNVVSTLKCNVIVTAHAQLVRDEMLGDIQWIPLIFGKDLPHRLGIWFDEVWMTTVTTKLEGGVPKTSYRMQVKPDQRFRILKSRMNQKDTFQQFEEPNFPSLLAKAAGET